MTKASTPEGLLALCPNELAGNKKSVICNNANDTVITLLNYAWIRTKLDTYIDSITENFAIVNPFAGKGHFMLGFLHSSCCWLYQISFKRVYAKNASYSVLSKNAIYSGSVSTCPVRPTL